MARDAALEFALAASLSGGLLCSRSAAQRVQRSRLSPWFILGSIGPTPGRDDPTPTLWLLLAAPEQQTLRRPVAMA